MDRERMKTAMRASISEVLEKMFFLPLEFFEADSPKELWKDPGAVDLTGARLSFFGSFSGSFLFLIPRKLGVALTADFMGVEPDAVPQEHVEQTVQEILNMIAGSTFSNLNEEAVFQLDIPTAVSAETLPAMLARTPEYVFLGVDTLEDRIALAVVKD